MLPKRIKNVLFTILRHTRELMRTYFFKIKPPYSDSQAAITSNYSTSTNSRTIADCRRHLHDMASQFTISLIWVPGHRDFVGNCIADELARQGTIMPLLPEKENVGMPMATCKLNIQS